MEQYLQAFCNDELDSLVDLFPLLKFAHNNAIHASMRMPPSWANYRYYQVMQFKAPKQPSSLKWDIQANTFTAG
jgi:hypothetical protein